MNLSCSDKTYLTKKNFLSFAFAGFGQNMIIGLVNSYILYFYTDIFVVNAGAISILMIVARIWDALNDPLMGTFVDKTRTRWGKMRPYILFITVPLGLSTMALFFMPAGLSETEKIVYASATYILWGMVYTVCDVPFWGLASSMTPNPQERISFISKSRLLHGIGGASPMLIVPIMTKLLGKEKGFTAAGIFVGIVGAALFFLAFSGTEERCAPADKAPTIKECFSFLKINKPLQKVVLANVLGFTRSLPVVAVIYVANYVIKSYTVDIFGFTKVIDGTTLNTVMIAGFGISGFAGMLLTPAITKKISYRAIYFISAVMGVTISLAMFFAGPNFYTIVIGVLLAGLPYGVVTNINYAMIAESVEYVEWKTGQRTEGITVSLQTLMNKLMTALQVAVVAFALIVLGFKQPVRVGEELINQEQSKFTLDGLFWLITVLPVIGWALSVIPMNFYDFVGKERARAQRELERARQIRAGIIPPPRELPEEYNKFYFRLRPALTREKEEI